MNRDIRIPIFVAISVLALLGLSSTVSAIASNEAVVGLIGLKGYAVVNIDACTSTLKYNFPGVTSTHGVALSSDGKVLLGGIGSIAVIDDSVAVAGDNSASGAVICTISIPGISVCGMTWQNRTHLWVGDDQTVAVGGNVGGLQEIIFSDPSNLCSYTLGAYLLTGNSICGVNFYTPEKGRYAGQELIYLQSMFGSSVGVSTDANPTVYKIDKATLSIEKKYMSKRHNASGGHMTDIMYNAPSTGGRKDVYYSTCGWERKVSGCHLPAGSHHNDINVDVNTTHTGEPHSVKAREGYLYVNARAHVGNLTNPYGVSRPYSYVLKIDEATGAKLVGPIYLSTGVPNTYATCGIVLTGTVGQQPP